MEDEVVLLLLRWVSDFNYSKVPLRKGVGFLSIPCLLQLEGLVSKQSHTLVRSTLYNDLQ